MATLNVSEILYDAELTDRFDVLRRQETIGTNGRSVVSVVRFPNVIGVVTTDSPNDLDRGEDYQKASRTISIVCRFILRSEVSGYQPDIVVWRGDNYVVTHIDSYPQFAAGFYQVSCTSMDKVDLPFDPAITGRLLGNQPRDSLNILIAIKR